MVKLADAYRLPIGVGMALETVRAQAALMLVLVTGGAVRGDSKEGFGQILDLDGRALRRSHVFRGVALVASQASVFALESVSGLFVVEGTKVPLDEGEVFPVVFGVAARAFLAGACGDPVGGMQALMRRQA